MRHRLIPVWLHFFVLLVLPFVALGVPIDLAAGTAVQEEVLFLGNRSKDATGQAIAAVSNQKAISSPASKKTCISKKLSEDQGAQNRAVSLKVLQKQLGHCPPRDYACKRQLFRLAGITTVRGYVVDQKNDDIILFGEVDTCLPPLRLDDFVVALRSAWDKYERPDPGCTIEPAPAMNKALDELSHQDKEEKRKRSSRQEQKFQELCERAGGRFNLQSRGDSKILRCLEARNPRIREWMKKFDTECLEDERQAWTRFKRRWRRICEGEGDNLPQQALVSGVQKNSNFAKVMFEADYDLKSLVDGLDPLDEVPQVASLMEIKESIVKTGEGHSISPHEYNRFWFLPGESRYVTDKEVAILRCCEVKLDTEEEYADRHGRTSGTGRTNALADEFVGSFNEHFVDVARHRPIYAKLKNLYRFVALAKILRVQSISIQAEKRLSYLLDWYSMPICKTSERRVKGVANFSEVGFLEKTFHFSSCGGVDMGVKISEDVLSKSTTRQLGRVRDQILSTRPSPTDLYWDVTLRWLVRYNFHHDETKAILLTDSLDRDHTDMSHM